MEVLRQAEGLSPQKAEVLAREQLKDDPELLSEALRALRAEDPPDFLTNPELSRNMVGESLGEFELIEEIGQGGMGTVYLARQPSLDRDVAVKVLVGAQTGGALPVRFRRESRALARLRHPNIVQVFAQGEENGVQYFAMELVDGVDFNRALAKLVGLTAKERTRKVAQWIHDAASALSSAHAAGVVHRDIKPQNLLIDLKGEVRVVDFGLALDLTSKEPSLTRGIMGTPGYMSPEQLSVHRYQIDERTDVYSCGVVLYEALTGQRPYAGTTVVELFEQISRSQVRSVRSLNPAAPAPLAWIVERALQVDPEERYASARDLADDLQAFLQGRPTQADAPTRAERLARFSRIHRRSLLTLGATAAAGVVGLGSSRLLGGSFRPSDRARLAFSRMPPGCQAVARPLDARTLLPAATQEAIDLGKTPLDERELPLGAWLVQLRRSGELVAEAHAYLFDPREQYLLPGLREATPARLEGMIPFAAGKWYDIDQGAEVPVDLPGFFIDAKEVTNREYRSFVLDAGAEAPMFWPTTWRGGFDERWAGRPVVEVDAKSARAFAAWSGKRLPTWMEWQRAARGPERLAYPWGSALQPGREDPEKANTWWNGRSSWTYRAVGPDGVRDVNAVRKAYLEFSLPVEQQPAWRSPEGLHRCLGNVREWTADISGSMKRTKWRPNIAMQLVAGSSWLSDPRELKIQSPVPIELMAEDLGFRCARSIP